MPTQLSALIALFTLTLTTSAQSPRPASPAKGIPVPSNLTLPRLPEAKPRNLILILTDDHRYDAMGFMNHPFLKTPNLDALAKNGSHVRNAFVTTALCSPSRATILTGLYAHQHGVVDNNNPVPKGNVFFPQYLQKAGYQTAFFGKWHMGGEGDDPQPGFDHWVSFRGQGVYLPNPGGFNVNGKHLPQKGYITDELTDYTLDWLDSDQRDRSKPFFVYLSHKAVHAEFIPAERHKGSYKDAKWTPPRTMADTPDMYKGKPMWVKNQRNSWHGVDFPYHSDLDVEQYYKQYCETFRAVDESIGRVTSWLRDKNLLDSTLVLYMGDNGFLFGEHGLIDKRNAYEESMRVPMVAHCPELIPPGKPIEQVVANLDVAPTFLAAAGLEAPAHMRGKSMLPLFKGKTDGGRDHVLYEYYWERNFPHTPTTFAIRTDRYKFIKYHGVWDLDELYDVRSDPEEANNLINDPRHRPTANQLRNRLFEELDNTGGMYIPLYPDRGNSSNLRRRAGSDAADFPEELMRNKNGRD